MPRRATGGEAAGQFGPDVYAAWRHSSLGDITEALEHRLLFELAGPLAGRAVLDVGCGDGTLAVLCAERGAGRICGCDPDPRMVQRARTRTAESGHDVSFTVAQAERLPFSDASFDVVFCVTVLTFVPDAQTAIQEMARVLRPNGRVIIGDLGKWSIWAARRRIRGWLGAVLWRGARFHTAGQIVRLLRDAGLSVTAMRGAIFFPPMTALARWMARFDRSFGNVTTFGAAFVAVRAEKHAL